MQHTNSQRGPDGRYGNSKGPKAKRVEVWLQPQTIELLDTLTKQWGVGRGKVIDQLLTRGPVPPQSWTEVTESPPTPSAPPEPTPKVDQEEFLDHLKQQPPGIQDMTKSFLETAEEVFSTPPEPEPTPEPSTSGRTSPFDDPEFIAIQEKMAQQWEVAKADAKVIGCKPERVQRFKAQQKLNPDRPLSVDAQQLLRDELDAEQRSAKGEANALQQRLQRLKERATNQRLLEIANAITPLSPMVKVDVAKVFLLEGLEDVSIKRRSKLVKGVWADLERLIPLGAGFDFEVCHLPEDNVAWRCLFWGTVIRLATLDGEPPQDMAAFLDWCGYSVHQSESERKANQWWSEFARTMSGKPSTTSDRQVLDLPEQGELTAAAIKSAFKTLARKHHPDAGGDAQKFQRIAEAKERLMLEVAA